MGRQSPRQWAQLRHRRDYPPRPAGTPPRRGRYFRIPAWEGQGVDLQRLAGPVESSANLPRQPTPGYFRRLSPASLKQVWTPQHTLDEIPFTDSGPRGVLRGNPHHPKPNIVVDVVARVAVPIRRTAVIRIVDPRTAAQLGCLPQRQVSTGEKSGALPLYSTPGSRAKIAKKFLRASRGGKRLRSVKSKREKG